ncbi:MAG: hypothetical protein ABI461_06670, partial [Polyangiaceae bacterium]
VSTDGLEGGDNDASTNDVSIPNETSTTNDSGIPDGSALLDASEDSPAPAPIVFVHTTDSLPPDAGSGDLTFAKSVLVGHTILVAVTFGGAATASVTDDKGDTFHLDVGPIGEGQGTTGLLFSAIGVPGNERVIHVTVGAGALYYTELYAMEYSGITRFDVGAGSYSSAAGAASSGFITTTIRNEMLLGFAVDGAVTAGPAFTSRNTANADLVEDRIVDAVGLYAATAQMSGPGMVLVGAYR